MDTLKGYKTGDSVTEDPDFRGQGNTADVFRSQSTITACTDDSSDKDYNIQEKDNGLFEHSFQVPKSFHPLLVGSKGSTRMRLERESNAWINIPERGSDGDIVLTAPKQANIVCARRQIDLMVFKARQIHWTHFLSIPMTAFKDQFVSFKERVLDECKSTGLAEDIFIRPDKLHITLGILTLLDEADRSNASETLKKCLDDVVNPILKGRSITVRVHGVDIMNHNPAKAHVLYGCIEDLSGEGLLQTLGDSVAQYFGKTGLMPKREKLKLHVTFLNTLHRKRSMDQDDTGRNGKWKRRQSFDATTVLTKFASTDFGEAVLDKIDISQRFQTGPDGYYGVSASIPISERTSEL